MGVSQRGSMARIGHPERGAMKSLLRVLRSILHDVEDVCSVSTARDFETVTRRVEEEGVSFLTITLPTFSKSLEAALERGVIASTDFAGFRRAGGLPAFLGGFLRLIFTRSGEILDVPDVDAIRAIRQVCLVLSKIELECTPRRTKRAFRQYVECENDVRSWTVEPSKLRELQIVFWTLFGDMMSAVGRQVDDCTLVPKHGPGATADRLKGNQKWNQGEWPARLERSFPMDAYLVPNHRHYATLSNVHVVEPGAERPVRVITVPKTLKTPRIIAIEPTCMQYAQQALLGSMSEFISRDDQLRKMVGLDDQTPNRQLACLGSLDGSLATLDLSEASDRVSNRLVFELTRPYRAFSRALQDCRSKRADVPGHGIIRLAKFASMGSAVCFPVEAMVFSAVATLGVALQRSTHLGPSAIRRAASQVRVFGDDIIVPSDCAETVSEQLALFGMMLNRHKSFWTGRFRESCGGDYYGGDDVSVHRLRHAIPTTAQDASGVAALFSFRNRCYQSGYWKTARLADSLLGALGLPLPRVAATSTVLGRLSFLGYETQRIHRDLHSPLVRGVKIASRPPVSPLGEVGALQKVLVSRRFKPLYQGHLERTGRPDRVYTQVGWGQPF